VKSKGGRTRSNHGLGSLRGQFGGTKRSVGSTSETVNIGTVKKGKWGNGKIYKKQKGMQIPRTQRPGKKNQCESSEGKAREDPLMERQEGNIGRIKRKAQDLNSAKRPIPSSGTSPPHLVKSTRWVTRKWGALTTETANLISSAGKAVLSRKRISQKRIVDY